MTKAQILGKFAKLFAYKGEKTAILQGIHYAADGSAIVTDRHQLLRIRDAHQLKEPITLRAKTGEPLEGAYPDMSRIWPNKHDGTVVIHQAALPDALLAAQCAAAVAVKVKDRGAPLAQLLVDDGKAYIDVVREAPFPLGLSTRISEDAPSTESKRSLNAEYLSNALAVFAAAGVGVTVRLIDDPYSPIVLTNEAGGIDVLILPIRTAP